MSHVHSACTKPKNFHACLLQLLYILLESFTFHTGGTMKCHDPEIELKSRVLLLACSL